MESSESCPQGQGRVISPRSQSPSVRCLRHLESKSPAPVTTARAWRWSTPPAPAVPRSHPCLEQAHPDRVDLASARHPSARRCSSSATAPGRSVPAQLRRAPTLIPGCHCSALRTPSRARRAARIGMTLFSPARRPMPPALGHHLPCTPVARTCSTYQPSPTVGLRTCRPATLLHRPRMAPTSPPRLLTWKTPPPTQTPCQQGAVHLRMRTPSHPGRAVKHGQRCTLSQLPLQRPSPLCLHIVGASPSLLPAEEPAAVLCSAGHLPPP